MLSSSGRLLPALGSAVPDLLLCGARAVPVVLLSCRRCITQRREREGGARVDAYDAYVGTSVRADRSLHVTVRPCVEKSLSVLGIFRVRHRPGHVRQLDRRNPVHYCNVTLMHRLDQSPYWRSHLGVRDRFCCSKPSQDR